MSSPSSVRLLALLLWLGALTGLPALRAAESSNAIGVRLLRAQLPARITIAQADCEQLVRAVGRATLAHRENAPAILSAALTGEINRDPRGLDVARPCGCVIRIFRASLTAAPAQASALLEVASALYPACADALAVALGEVAATVARGPGNPEGDDPIVGNSGFGAGFGPGFPGSPGFTGSGPAGALSLPTPPAVTSVVNG